MISEGGRERELDRQAQRQTEMERKTIRSIIPSVVIYLQNVSVNFIWTGKILGQILIE